MSPLELGGRRHGWGYSLNTQTIIHNTPTRTTQTQGLVPCVSIQLTLSQGLEGQHLAHVTLASFLCSRHATRTALTDSDTDQSRHTPGDSDQTTRNMKPTET